MKYLTTIMYHYVRDRGEAQHPAMKGITVHQFEEQIVYFKRFYNFVSISDCIAYLDCDDHTMPENPILLTFDDAYIDHYKNVFPILKKHKIQGAFFAPVKAIKRNKVLDVNKIHLILASCPINILLNETRKKLSEHRAEFSLQDYNYYFNKLAHKNHLDCKEIIFFKRLFQCELEYDLRSMIIDELFQKYVTDNEPAFARTLYMNTDNMREMIEGGMFFGVHGNNHLWLNKISPKEQEDEITLSLDFLSDVGMSMTNWIISYPYGAYNDALLRLLRSLHCKLAFTTKPEISRLSRENALTLERYDTIHFPFAGDAQSNEITENIRYSLK